MDNVSIKWEIDIGVKRQALFLQCGTKSAMQFVHQAY